MDLVTQYLIEAHAECRSPKTLAWHRDSLKQFMAWLAATGLSGDPESWTVADVRSYIVYQQGRTNMRTNQPLWHVRERSHSQPQGLLSLVVPRGAGGSGPLCSSQGPEAANDSRASVERVRD
jgi:hypothetical protein